jgi:phosphoenolpyruvate synthase/pyruvate phosphate dikinase
LRGRVLTNLQARSLAKLALRIRAIFGNKSEQDIEWGILRGQIYVLQARPYLEKK